MIGSWSDRLAAAAFLVPLALAPVRAAAQQPGVLWETTSQPVMEGMPMQMPAQKSTVCAANQWTRPPAGGDPSCKSSNFRMVGSKATWTVQCAGNMPMTGAGEMTFNGTDSYTGTVKFTGEGMSMTVKLSGTKVGTCPNPQ